MCSVSSVSFEDRWMSGSGAASATGRSPHTELSGVIRVGDEHRRRKLDDDRHVVESGDEVDRRPRRAEGASGSGQDGQRTGARPSVGQNAEELLEIDEERIVARAGEELNAV